jgi:hypothetical protein
VSYDFVSFLICYNYYSLPSDDASSGARAKHAKQAAPASVTPDGTVQYALEAVRDARNRIEQASCGTGQAMIDWSSVWISTHDCYLTI